MQFALKPTDKPTHTFEEVIEKIRTAKNYDEINKLRAILKAEKKCYCLFHLQLIQKALYLISLENFTSYS